ncbi:MAG: PilZ domain-containing protein [Bacillota bacterium]
MPNFGRRIDGPAGRRRVPREQVVLAGSALTLGSSRAVVVTDVSPSGAKLLGRKLPGRGTDVLLSVGSVELFGEVVWLARDECGIVFETPLDAHTVEHLKRDGRWAKVMGVIPA